MIIDHPVVGKLRDLQSQERSGCLLLKRRDESARFFIQQGRVDAASSSLAELRLGQLLLKDGLIRTSGLRKLLRKAKRSKRPLGEMILHVSAVRLSAVNELLCHQAFLIFQRAVDYDFQVESFDEHAKEFSYPCRIPLQALLLGMARRCNRSVDSDASAIVTLLHGSPEDFAQIPWDAREVAVLSCLRTPSSIADLIGRHGLSETEVRQLLGTLQLMGYAEVSQSAPAEQEQLSGQPPLEWIVPAVNGEFASPRLEILKDQHSFISEQFKSLKISLNGLAGDEIPQIVGVSSPFMGDGKSLVSSNLSMALSRDLGRRVILVDCDLRKPTAQEYLGVPQGPGLVHYLEEDHDLPPFSFMRRFHNLYILTAGRVADNPVELLSLKRMRELIDYLRQEFDAIILDCPPFEPISDARILAKLTDGMLLVVRSGKTPYVCAERTLKSVDPDKILGLVLNDVKPIVFNTYYNYSYYYYGERGAYPYSSKPRPKKRS